MRHEEVGRFMYVLARSEIEEEQVSPFVSENDCVSSLWEPVKHSSVPLRITSIPVAWQVKSRVGREVLVSWVRKSSVPKRFKRKRGESIDNRAPERDSSRLDDIQVFSERYVVGNEIATEDNDSHGKHLLVWVLWATGNESQAVQRPSKRGKSCRDHVGVWESICEVNMDCNSVANLNPRGIQKQLEF